jgi:hypothetical protein
MQPDNPMNIPKTGGEIILNEYPEGFDSFFPGFISVNRTF